MRDGRSRAELAVVGMADHDQCSLQRGDQLMAIQGAHSAMLVGPAAIVLGRPEYIPYIPAATPRHSLTAAAGQGVYPAICRGMDASTRSQATSLRFIGPYST